MTLRSSYGSDSMRKLDAADRQGVCMLPSLTPPVVSPAQSNNHSLFTFSLHIELLTEMDVWRAYSLVEACRYQVG